MRYCRFFHIVSFHFIASEQSEDPEYAGLTLKPSMPIMKMMLQERVMTMLYGKFCIETGFAQSDRINIVRSPNVWIQ